MSTWDSEIDAWLIFIRGVCLRPQILSKTSILKTLHFDLYLTILLTYIYCVCWYLTANLYIVDYLPVSKT